MANARQFRINVITTPVYISNHGNNAIVVPQKIIPWRVARKRGFPELVRTKPRAKKNKIIGHLRDPAL